MFDILEFIDSKDIREYNVSTFFYPIEKAVLINESLYTSVEKKLDAWKKLLETYDEAQFEERATIDYYENNKQAKTFRSKRAIVADTVEQYELALKQCDEVSAHVIFKASIQEIDHSITTQLFSSFQNAHHFIKDTVEDNCGETKYVDISIDTIKLDSDIINDHVCRYSFAIINGALEMTSIWRKSSVDYADFGLDTFFVNIPLPFQKGDIVKLIYPDELYAYGVIEDDMKTFFLMRRSCTVMVPICACGQLRLLKERMVIGYTILTFHFCILNYAPKMSCHKNKLFFLILIKCV